MKTSVILTLATILVLSTSCIITKTSPELVSVVKNEIESGDFTVKINYANPTRWQQITLTSPYSLQIKNDSAFAYLPYYGVAYRAPLNINEGGIIFKEKMYDYTKYLSKKKDGWEIKFIIRTIEYNYSFHLTIFENGSSSASVNCYERDPITFYGELILSDEKYKK